jgi:phospholipase C
MGLYFHETWYDSKCYTEYTFPFIDQVDSSLMEIVQIDDPNSGFYARAKAGTLPMFSYIEPKWGGA